MVDTVFTIGYSGIKINDFITMLIRKNISLVIDVRSLPYSRYYSDYNKENLYNILKKNGIYYRNYAIEFGARQENLQYYPRGYLDFEMFAKSDNFLTGVDKLKKSMEQDYTFVLMCSEKDPLMCHRAILVSRAFHVAGYNVQHLLYNNKIVTQIDLEERLLNKFFPDRNQISLFTNTLSPQEYIDEAYRKQNANIGYSIEEENS